MREGTWFIREIDGSNRTGGQPPRLLFPGSFRPLHAGHRLLAAIAARRFGLAVTFELSRTNVDKAPLDDAEIEGRLRPFAGYAPVAVTDAPTFAEKARLFTGCRFVAGADTALRLLDSKYHGGDCGRRDAALDEMYQNGHRFLIGGRSADGRFLDLSALDIPESYRPMFEGLSEAEFRMDISSTALRSGGISPPEGG